MKKYTYYILSAVVLIFFADHLQKLHYAPDDTYIYLQYAKNIASGNGFSFNPGEQSYGVTSPLWVMILTLPFFAGFDAFWFSKIADLLCALAAILLFFRLASAFFKDEILIVTATIMFALNAWFIRWAFTGMETSCAVMLVVLIFLLYFQRRFSLMFFILGLFYLTRPEGFILVLVLFTIVLTNKIRHNEMSFGELGKYIMFTAIPVVSFLVYAKLSFDTFLPNTALGKSTLTLKAGVFIAQVVEISKTLAGASLVEIFLSIVSIFLIIYYRKFFNLAPILVWIFALVTLYIVTDADIISRYLLIISPFIILIGLTAITFLKNNKNIFIVSALIISVFYSQFIFYKFVKPSTDDFTIGMNECLIPEGKWLKENTPLNSKILVNDVGAIGYFSERYIIDAAALINRDLELNRKIMATPLEDRLVTHRLLNFIQADYVIDRDSNDTFVPLEYGNFTLKPEFMKKFPSLGISDTSPRYFKIYKINDR